MKQHSAPVTGAAGPPAASLLSLTTFSSVAVRYQPDASGSSGRSRLTSSPPYFSPSWSIIQKPCLSVGNVGSPVRCQPEAILFLSDSFGTHYLLPCLAVYYTETWRCCQVLKYLGVADSTQLFAASRELQPTSPISGSRRKYECEVENVLRNW